MPRAPFAGKYDINVMMVLFDPAQYSDNILRDIVRCGYSNVDIFSVQSHGYKRLCKLHDIRHYGKLNDTITSPYNEYQSPVKKQRSHHCKRSSNCDQAHDKQLS
jgi:hypothetical protein